jgi:hypothetical protein
MVPQLFSQKMILHFDLAVNPIQYITLTFDFLNLGT